MTYCTLLRGPVTKALAIALVDVHRLVAVPCPPGVMVDVTHHLRLYLQPKLASYPADYELQFDLNVVGLERTDLNVCESI